MNCNSKADCFMLCVIELFINFRRREQRTRISERGVTRVRAFGARIRVSWLKIRSFETVEEHL